MIRTKHAIAALTASALAFASPAMAQYSFVRIDTSASLTGVYAGNLSNQGEVAFTGFYAGNASGIYKGSGGPLTTIAQTGPQFSYFNAPSINCHGEVGFRGILNGPGNGAYRGNGGPVTTIHAATNGVDFGGIDDNGTVVLYDNSMGVLTGNGGPLTTIASVGSQFIGLGNLPHMHGGTTVFQGILPGNISSAWSSTNGVLSQIAVAGGNIANIQQPRIRWGKTIWESNLTNGDQAIITNITGNTSTFVDTSGPYLQFGFHNSHAINFYDQVAFSARLDASPAGVGIYTGPNPATDAVISPGDSLAGKTVLDAYFGGLNDRGQISFGVMFSDYTYGMFRADPAVLNPDPGCNMPAPGACSLLALGALFAPRRRRNP